MQTLLDAHKDKKAGKTTVYTLVGDLLEEVKNGSLDALVYVAVAPNGHIWAGWSHNSLTALGMLEAGKGLVREDMKLT